MPHSLSSLGGVAGYSHLRLYTSCAHEEIEAQMVPNLALVWCRGPWASCSYIFTGCGVVPVSLLNSYLQLPEIKWIARPSLQHQQRNLELIKRRNI